MPSIQQFFSGLEERFGAALQTLSDGTVQVELRGRQKVLISFDESTRTAAVKAPVMAANRSLPPTLLNELLKRNFPDSTMAGSLLAAYPGEEVLMMVNVIPLASAEPQMLAGIAMAQGQAAIQLSNWVLTHRDASREDGEEAYYGLDADDDADDGDDDDGDGAADPEEEFQSSLASLAGRMTRIQGDHE